MKKSAATLILTLLLVISAFTGCTSRSGPPSAADQETKNELQLRSLELRIAHIICSFDEVQSAELSIQRDENGDTTASAEITLNDNDSLSAEQLDGIKNIICDALPDLPEENLVIEII